jgi:hypothetical protein
LISRTNVRQAINSVATRWGNIASRPSSQKGRCRHDEPGTERPDDPDWAQGRLRQTDADVLAAGGELYPGPSADTPYETRAALLPKTLLEAVDALKDDPFFREALGAGFVDYYVHIKNAEIERFQAEVSDWEQREYFEMF